jgi:uncharacterized repeat protein (TIGR03803 family)
MTENKRITRGAAALLILCLSAFSLEAGTFATLTSFSLGTSPYGGLVQAENGNLYGTTQGGGLTNHGTIFSIATNGLESTLYSFTGGKDGAHPFAPLIQGQDGELYGTTEAGGASQYGTIFKISTNGQLTTLYSFTGGADGAYPFGSLVQVEGGGLYGTASQGGSGYGTIYRLTTNGAFTLLYEFSGAADGAYPYTGLLLANDGNLYGTAIAGGANASAGISYGTVFQFSLGGTFTPLYSFSGGDGAYPYGRLVQGLNGNLFGTTSGTLFQSGVAPVSFGTVFEITYGGVFTSVYSFAGGSDGANPYAGLCQASDGNLYGTTTGGTTNSGNVFSITVGGVLTSLVAFNGGNGGSPYGSLVQAIDGNLYGTTLSGGASDGGTVFQYTLTSPPFIITQPVNQTATNHSTAVFQVVAGGTGALTYQWLTGGTNLTDGGNIAGSSTSTLTISDVSSAQQGYYAVLVSSGYGQVASSNAYLSVVTVKPTLAITHPTANERVSNAVISVTGKTKCKLPMSAVFWQLNGTGWNPAQSSNGWTNWSATMTLNPGTNLIQAYAVDASGDSSTTNKVKFWYILSAPITVLTNGFGTVTPKDNGKMLAINETYTITAHPGLGFAFTNWSGSTNSTNPKLTFLMQSNLSYTANFVDVRRPVLAILSPKSHQRWSNSVFTVIGKASDNVAVASVFYQLGNTGWTLAQTSNGWTNWTATIELSPGTNVLEAYAVDTSGNHSLTNTARIVYLTPASRVPRKR